jgi:hypothetical protein
MIQVRTVTQKALFAARVASATQSAIVHATAPCPWVMLLTAAVALAFSDSPLGVEWVALEMPHRQASWLTIPV